jgi:hypothetical protein
MLYTGDEEACTVQYCRNEAGRQQRRKMVRLNKKEMLINEDTQTSYPNAIGRRELSEKVYVFCKYVCC